jgi:hypothetical protein
MSKKKVTAPTTYNPGSGHPKEYLAYLNWQEMEALRRLNGNGPRRGPKGIPSFADDSASSMGNERPPEDSYDGYQGGGDGGFDGNSYNDVGGESGGGGDYGGSDYGGVGSESGAGYSDAGSTSGDAYGGVSSSDTSDSYDAREGSDQSAINSADASGGIAALEGSPALANDISKPSYTYGSGYERPSDSMLSGAISRISSQMYKDVTPTSPGAGGGFGSLDTRRSSLISPVGPSSGIEALGNIGPTRMPTSLTSKMQDRVPAYNPSVSPIEREPVYSPPPSPTFSPNAMTTNIGSGFNRRMRDVVSQNIFGATGYVPGFRGVVSPTEEVGTAVPSSDVELASKSPDVKKDISKLVDSTSFASGMSFRGFVDKIPASIPATPADHMTAVLGTSYERRWAPGEQMMLRPSEELSQRAGLDALAATEDQRRNSPTVPAAIGDRTNPFAKYASDSLPPGYREKYLGTEIMVEDVPPEVVEGVPQEVYGPINVDPEIQDIMERYDKINNRVVSGGETLLRGALAYATAGLSEPVFKLINKGTEYFTGMDVSENITNPSSAARRALMQARTDEERQQIIAENPQLVPFARDAGVDVTDENLRDWQDQRIERGVVPPGAPIPGLGGSSYQGGIPTKELGGKNPWWDYQFTRNTSYSPPPSRSTKGGKASEDEDLSKKELYRRWDRGIGIPSPGDPSYNEYKVYLINRGQGRYS